MSEIQLTILQAAERLGMTPDGVYKLIQRGKLEATRVSARKTRIAGATLERYISAQQEAVRRFRDGMPPEEPAILRERFEVETGYAPEAWLTAWKREAIPDTPENMLLLVRAVALRGDAGAVPISRPEAHPWALAAFAETREPA